MSKSKIKITRNNNLFTIEKNKNYQLFFSMSVVFYQKLIEIMQKTEGIFIQLNPKFENLLIKLNLDNEKIELDENDLKLLVDWTDCLCLIMLDLDSIDFKNKDIKKYLQISESLISTSKELI